MFNPHWLHTLEESKIVLSQEEHDNLWKEGWRDTPGHPDLSDEPIQPKSKAGRPRKVQP